MSSSAAEPSRRDARAPDAARPVERRPWPTDDPLEAALALGSLFAGTRVGFALIGTDARYVLANDVFSSWTGVPPPELAGRDAAATPGGLRMAAERLRAVVADIRPRIDLLDRVEAADGTARDLRVSYIPIVGSSHRLLGVAVVARDLTAQQAMQDELDAVSALRRRESSLLRTVVEHVPVGIVVTWGPEYRFLLVNERGRRMLPVSGDLVGRTLAEIFADQPDVLALGEQLYGQVFTTGEGERLEELAVPFGDPGSFEGNRYYDVTLTPIFQDGDVAGILVVYVEMTDQVRRRRDVESRLEREREVALALQRSLLPAALPQAAGIRFASAYRAGRHGELVGGDFFDVLPWRGRWLLIVGDVEGKGVRAAGTMALVRHALRGSLLHRQTLEGVLADLNRILLEEATQRRSCRCTVAVASLATENGAGELTVALAGHPPPVLVRASGGVDDGFVPGTLLGATSTPRFTETTRAVAPGDVLLLYSDGLPEAHAPAEWIDVPAAVLEAFQAAADAEAMVAALLGQVMDGGPPRDDLTLLAAQTVAPAGGRP